jgi:hypothetical protein
VNVPKFFSHPKFLSIYSCVVTLAFASVVLLGARERPRNADFDQITVHRVNIVEPDGTVRMVLADKAEFPGAYFMGKEYPRTDRDATGMLFNDDEGTENGGLIFGGNKDKDGVTHSYGHLSFDEYHQDQTMVLESDSDGDSRSTQYSIEDTSSWPVTPEVSAQFQGVKAMPPGPARGAAWKALQAKYPASVERGYFGRGRDKSISLTLSDQQGHARLIARVAADGTPVLQFLDAQGKILRTIDPTSK